MTRPPAHRLPTSGPSVVREMFRWNLRDRVRLALGVGAGLALMAVMVYALHPSIAATFGDFGDELPEGVANLFGGGEFSSLAGWMNTEMVSIMLPFGLLLTGGALGAAWSAGREEDGTVALLLSTPASRRAATVAAGLAALVLLSLVTALSLLGWAVGDALIQESLAAERVLATHLHLWTLGVFGAMLALAVGAATGRRLAALWSVGGLGVASFLVTGFAPTVASLAWTENLSPFSWAVGHRPLLTGLDVPGLVVLLGAAAVLWALALWVYDRRDLRL